MRKFKKILILGSGALKIGEAGEFDYSGSQALKALKEEKVKTVLVNPNIATVQTTKGLADRIYFLPVNEYFVEKIIEKEKPDGILLSFGGQTALNCGLRLEELGVLKKHKVKVLGTSVSSIRLTEDRQLFADHLRKINIPTPKSQAVYNLLDAKKIAKGIGYPVMVRAGFALGGQNSGIVKNEKELTSLVEKALQVAPQVLIEKYLHHYKEIEYEVVRDSFGNTATVCNMENIDPLGIHTGDSIVVAPSQTLNNFEYHILRKASLSIVQSLGIVGECNVQYALNPNPPKGKEIDFYVIEVNARLSRSSALASKATGYPLAYVAAKLALGTSLTKIKNQINKTTQSFFEPAMDYLAVKMPRWDLEKFKGAEEKIGSAMKSVGETMALGRSFEEALQKAVRMQSGRVESITDNGFSNKNKLLDFIKIPTPKRIFAIANAIKNKVSLQKVHKLSGIDMWFLHRVKNIVETENQIVKNANKLDKEKLLIFKQNGFSDKKIGELTGRTQFEIRKLRKGFGIKPFVFQIDTLAGEFPAKTNYLYLTYHGLHNDVLALGKNSVIILGSGPYHIGSSVEFDWSSVMTARALSRHSKKSIVINCNPETVSTDYDISTRLYFEDVSFETVSDIYEFENPESLVVSMGGQKPNNLVKKLSKEKFKILGTLADNIDRAENRSKFSELLDELGIAQPKWQKFTSFEEAKNFAKEVGFPVLVRPSYVLSGSAMKVCFSDLELKSFLENASVLGPEHPVTVSKFIENAKELEFDGVAQKGEIVLWAISEHIENAGVHSGDATIVYPTQRVFSSTERKIRELSAKIVKALKVSGPFNIQFLVKDHAPYVIEVNLRASRTFPFLSKAMNVNFVDVSVDAFYGKAKKFVGHYPKNVLVKSPQFSFARLTGADPILQVEMSSTGEIACFGDSFDEAILKSVMSVSGFNYEKKNVLLSLGGILNKEKFAPFAKLLNQVGYNIYATENTAKFFISQNIKCDLAEKIFSNKEGKNNVLNIIKDKRCAFAVVLSDFSKINDFSEKALKISDGYLIRRCAVENNLPLFTDLHLARAFVKSLTNMEKSELKIKAYDEYEF